MFYLCDRFLQLKKHCEAGHGDSFIEFDSAPAPRKIMLPSVLIAVHVRWS